MANKKEKDGDVHSKRPIKDKIKLKLPDHMERTVIAIVASLAIIMSGFVVASKWESISNSWENFWHVDEPLVVLKIVPMDVIEPPVIVSAELVDEPTPVPTGMERVIASGIAHSDDVRGMNCMILAPEFSTELEYGATRRGCEYTVIPQQQGIMLCIEDIGCHDLLFSNL